MKKQLSILILVLFFIAAGIYMSFFSGKETRVFILPHREDELLSFGVSLNESIREGHDVEVLLLSNKSDDILSQILQGEIYCTWHETYHDSLSEHYTYEGEPVETINQEMIINLRQLEFENSLSAFDIEEENIHLTNPLLGNEALTEANIEKAIRSFIKGKRKVHLFTFHPSLLEGYREEDHLITGKAADRVAQGEDLPITFFIEPTLSEHFHEVDTSIITREADGKAKLAMEASLSAYSLYHPSESHYALGYHGDGTTMDELEEHMTNYQVPR